MKYLHNNALFMPDDDEKTIREKDKLFEKQSNLFWNEYNTIKNQLPKGVTQFFERHHDSNIKDIDIIYKLRGIDVAIELKQYASHKLLSHGILLHHNVSEFTSNIIETRGAAFSCDTFAYSFGELYLDDDGYWVHNFLIHPVPNEIYIKCKRLEWIDKSSR